MIKQLHDVAHMLVIDPDEAAMGLVMTELSALGWHVDYVRTFHDALALVTKYSYDFVILELVLPDALASDAWALIRKINPDVLGVITTSSPSLFRLVNPREPGILSFLLKPFELSMVRDAAAHLLEYQRLRAENQKLERKLIGLANLASNLSSVLTPTEAIKTTLAHLSPTRLAGGVLIYLFDDKSMSWSLKMTSGTLAFGRDRNDFFPFAEGLLFEAVETLLPIILNDTQVFDARDGVTSLAQLQLKAIAVIPILAGGRSLGALALVRGMGQANGFSKVEVQFATITSQIIGLVLTNLQLRQPADEYLLWEGNSIVNPVIR